MGGRHDLGNGVRDRPEQHQEEEEEEKDPQPAEVCGRCRDSDPDAKSSEI